MQISPYSLQSSQHTTPNLSKRPKPLIHLLPLMVVVVVLGKVGGGGGVEGVGRDKTGDCNHGSAIDKSLKQTCVWLHALVFQLLVCGGSYYGRWW